MEDEDVPAPSKGYDLSFLDKLDDPNFDPFKTKSSVTNDIQTTNRSCSPPINPKIQNDETSNADGPKSRSHRIEKCKIKKEAIQGPIQINKDPIQANEPIQEVSNSDEIDKSQKKSAIKSKPRPLRSDTFKIKENKNKDKSSKEEIRNHSSDTIIEDEESQKIIEETSRNKKMVRSGTFTKSDTDEASDSQVKDELKDGTKRREKPKKTILSKLMIKSQRKMGPRSKTMSNIELDHTPQTPKSPSLDIDALLESIHSSKVSETANVFEFLETSNEDDEQKTPRKMSLDNSSFVVSPDFSINDDDIMTPRRMSIDTTSYVVPADFSSEEKETSRKQKLDTSSYVVSPDFANNPNSFAKEAGESNPENVDVRLKKLYSDELENESKVRVFSDFKPIENDNKFYSLDNNLKMQYSMVDDHDTLNSLFSLSNVSLENVEENEILSTAEDTINHNNNRNTIDDYKQKKEKAKRLQDQISQLREELARLKRNEDLVENFKATINDLLSSREKDRVYHEIEKERISHEKSQLIDDLLSAENSYKDVKGKYERSRDLIIRYKTDEDNLKIILNDRMDKLKEKEQRFDRLKFHAEDKVQQANDAILEIQTNGEVEMARLNTMLRKSELKVETLDQTMRQKSEESWELAKMCDELICSAQTKPRYAL